MIEKLVPYGLRAQVTAAFSTRSERFFFFGVPTLLFLSVPVVGFVTTTPIVLGPGAIDALVNCQAILVGFLVNALFFMVTLVDRIRPPSTSAGPTPKISPARLPFAVLLSETHHLLVWTILVGTTALLPLFLISIPRLKIVPLWCESLGTGFALGLILHFWLLVWVIIKRVYRLLADAIPTPVQEENDPDHAAGSGSR